MTFIRPICCLGRQAGFFQNPFNRCYHKKTFHFPQNFFDETFSTDRRRFCPFTIKGRIHQRRSSDTYRALCTEYYELDKPHAPYDALACYLKYAAEANGPILEPMCGTGRFLIPLLRKGFNITGFDSSSHMLDLCRKKCQKENLTCTLLDASFESFFSGCLYQLIFIPSGSFCLLVTRDQVKKALTIIYKYLGKGGKFVFEIDTPMSTAESDGIWKCSWVNHSDKGKIMQTSLSHFNTEVGLQNILTHYALWEGNIIKKTEVEKFTLKTYTTSEIEKILNNNGFKLVNKFIPYSNFIPNEKSKNVLYECVKI